MEDKQTVQLQQVCPAEQAHHVGSRLIYSSRQTVQRQVVPTAHYVGFRVIHYSFWTGQPNRCALSSSAAVGTVNGLTTAHRV